MNLVHNRFKKVLIAFLGAAALTGGGSALAAEEISRSSPQVDALVRQVIKAYGGTAVLKNLHSLSARGVLDSPLYARPSEYSYDLERDRKLRVEVRPGDFFELRILNGTKGYYRTSDSPLVEVSRSRFLSMVYQFKELTMPLQLMTSSFAINDGGIQEMKGVPARVLQLRDSEGPPMKLYIDLRTHRIVRDSGTFTMDGGETELSSEFHDFRKAGGLLLPYRIVNYAGGQRIGEVRIREYRINPQLLDSLFTPDAAATR